MSNQPDVGVVVVEGAGGVSGGVQSPSIRLAVSASMRSMEEQPPAIPVACSASDELEKIALREYQSSSNDIFFTEIERQAKEQYDGNPENSCCPPNKYTPTLGGPVFYCGCCCSTFMKTTQNNCLRYCCRCCCSIRCRRCCRCCGFYYLLVIKAHVSLFVYFCYDYI